MSRDGMTIWFGESAQVGSYTITNNSDVAVEVAHVLTARNHGTKVAAVARATHERQMGRPPMHPDNPEPVKAHPQAPQINNRKAKRARAAQEHRGG